MGKNLNFTDSELANLPKGYISQGINIDFNADLNDRSNIDL